MRGPRLDLAGLVAPEMRLMFDGTRRQAEKTGSEIIAPIVALGRELVKMGRMNE